MFVCAHEKNKDPNCGAKCIYRWAQSTSDLSETVDPKIAEGQGRARTDRPLRGLGDKSRVDQRQLRQFCLDHPSHSSRYHEAHPVPGYLVNPDEPLPKSAYGHIVDKLSTPARVSFDLYVRGSTNSAHLIKLWYYRDQLDWIVQNWHVLNDYRMQQDAKYVLLHTCDNTGNEGVQLWASQPYAVQKLSRNQ